MNFIIGFVLGMALSYIIHRFIVWSTLKQMEREGIEIDELLERVKQKVAEKVVQARLEEHQGVFYLYRVDTGEFIAQGSSHAEVERLTELRIPNLPVYVTEADEAVMERYRATQNVA